MLEMGILPDVAAATSATMMCATHAWPPGKHSMCCMHCRYQLPCMPPKAALLQERQAERVGSVPCSMFTAASASVVYLSFGGIPFDYGMATFISGLLWTMLGQVRAVWVLLHPQSLMPYMCAALMGGHTVIPMPAATA